MTPFDHCVSLVEQQCIRRRGLEPRRPCTVSEDKYVSVSHEKLMLLVFCLNGVLLSSCDDTCFLQEAHTTIASEMLGGRLIESNQQNLVP
ncbi:unnamed protein product [Malus baccata var. baccata]